MVVFPKDLRQYVDSITSSAWDLANVTTAVGFSGTKDNRWLFPTYLKYSECSSRQIKGTDGKMIDLLAKCT
jgi:hypothetical protein